MKKWKEVRLQDLVYFQRGFDITKDKQELGDVPVISSSGVTSYHNKYMADGPGVIMGRKGSLGTIYFSKENYWPHDTTLWSKDFKGNDPKYAYYFLHTFDFKNFNVGGANPTLNRNHIHDLRIPLPPLPTQQRIAAILSAYDDLIENNRRRITLLEDSARLLYKEWFVKFQFPGHEKVKVKNGLPEGWERKKIGDIIEVGRGSSPRPIADTRYFEDGTIPWIKIADATASKIFIHRTKEYVNEFGASFSRKLKPGSMILAASGTLGFPMFLGVEACIHDGWLYFEKIEEYFKEYFYFNLLDLRNYFQNQSLGSAIQNINTNVVRETPLILPQKQIINLFSEKTNPIFKQIHLLQVQTQKLREARNILLPKLMNGTIEV
jgi:type I restriction enzyme S subunit